jgi:hypothetical protein
MSILVFSDLTLRCGPFSLINRAGIENDLDGTIFIWRMEGALYRRFER